MFVPSLIDIFKHKVVKSIIILACWSPLHEIKFIREISKHGFQATISCDGSSFGHRHRYGLQGVIYFRTDDDSLLEKVNAEYFSNSYIWLIIDEKVPDVLKNVRYDAELTLYKPSYSGSNMDAVFLEDIHVHPSEGISTHPWAVWTQTSGLMVTHNIEKIRRKLDLQGYPLRISAPVGHYSEDWYNGTYVQYIQDETLTELDGGLRSAFDASMLLIDALNATNVIEPTLLWGTLVHNSSMVLKLYHGNADLSGGILRMMNSRLELLSYVMPIWPFNVGFTYLADRESNSNMFVEPFTSDVWWTCLAIGFVLAIAQRVTSRSQEEKDGSYYAVLATCLQQDASAVPNGVSGRWTFLVLSVCSMLVHAYYTSAIVSALMSSGRSGPDSLRTLADSRYAIASEDYDYMRYFMFSVETNWDDMEYLKKKKMTSKLYQELERGVELIQEGNTAFHSEYNQIYPHFKTFTDDQICKLQHVDTIPAVMTWVTTTPKGQWLNVMRSTGAWLYEVGLARRVTLRLLAIRPPCRSALLAERVKIGDIAPLLALTAFGAILSLLLLGVEIFFAKWKMRSQRERKNSTENSVSGQTYSVSDQTDLL